MSNSRSYRRHLQPVEGSSSYEKRKLSDAEFDRAVAEWIELTDEVVPLLSSGAYERAAALLGKRRDELERQWGAVACTVGPVIAASQLTAHVLFHVGGFEDLGDKLESSKALREQNRIDSARVLAQGILADAAGIDTSALNAAVALLDRVDEDAAAIAIVVWGIFCAAGAEYAIGAAWCDNDECGGSGEIDDSAEAAADVGAAAALVALAGAGEKALATSLAANIAGELLLPDGVASCLALLERGGELDETTVRAVCHETMERRAGDDVGEEDDTHELLRSAERVAARLGGGLNAGTEALRRLDGWLGGLDVES